MDFRGLASHVDTALPDALVRSHAPSAKLRRPPSLGSTRPAQRSTLDRSRTDRSNGEMSSWSDNRTSLDESQKSFFSDSPHDRPKTRSSIRTHENKLPSSGVPRFTDSFPYAPEVPDEATLGRRKGKRFQRKDAAPEESTKRRARAGRQQRTDSNSNDHRYINRSSTRLEGSDAHRASGTGSTLAGSSQLIRGKASPADMGMRTLLVYRAVLFATLCALAADTSCVYETELGRRIVQVL